LSFLIFIIVIFPILNSLGNSAVDLKLAHIPIYLFSCLIVLISIR